MANILEFVAYQKVESFITIESNISINPFIYAIKKSSNSPTPDKLR